MRFNLFTAFTLGLGTFTEGSSVWGLTIEELPALIAAQNTDVATSEIDQKIARENISVANARFYPTLELKNTYTRLNDDVVIDIPAQRIERDIFDGTLSVAIDVDPPPVKVQDKNIFNSHLLLTQPIYAGSRIIAGRDAALAQKDVADAAFDHSFQSALTVALTRYFQVIVSHDISQNLINLKTNLDRLEAIAKSLLKNGVVSQLTPLQIAVAVADLNAKIEDAKNKHQLAEMAFKSTVNLNPLDSLKFDTALRKVELAKAAEIFVSQGLRQRSEFKLLEAQKAQASALKQVKTGEMLPTVYAFGKYELLKNQLTALQPEWAVGVGLDIPLTAGLSKFAERHTASLMIQKVDEIKKRAMRDIPLQIDQAYITVKSKNLELQTIEAAIEVAREALRIAEVRLKNGHGSSMELISSNSDLEKLVIKRLLVLDIYNRNLIELYAAAGDVNQFIKAYTQGLN